MRNQSWLNVAINQLRRVPRPLSELFARYKWCVALINGKPPTVRAKFKRATDAGVQVFVSSVALFDLWYGIAKSSRREFNRKPRSILEDGSPGTQTVKRFSASSDGKK
jgi:hypothetical protein